MQEEKRGIDGFSLKRIAMAAMLCSHIYKCLLVTKPQWQFLDLIGRISFPIMCFLLVEGYCHTASKKAYLARLWIFAVLSEIPFDLAFYGKMVALQTQNVLFAFPIGILGIGAMERVRKPYRPAALGVAMALAWLVRVDYGWYGILLMGLFARFRGMKREQTQVQAGVLVAGICLYGWTQLFAVCSLIPLWFYNGKRGIGAKYVFYWFYPLHLLALYLIRNVKI